MVTNFLNRIALRFSILCLTLVCISSGMQADEPDFAYPQKVEKNAAGNLKAALKSGNSQRIVESLIQLGIARSMVNTDSLPSILRQVEQVEARENNVVTKALLNLWLSEIYTEIYSADSYRYDAREESATAGDDYRLWNRRQFARKVVSLVRKALDNPNELQRVPISNYQDVILLSVDYQQFYPTLLDFVGTVGVNNICSFISGNERMLNAGLLNHPTDRRLFPSAVSFPMAETLDVYKLLIERNEDREAALFTQCVAAEKFINRHIFNYEDAPYASQSRRNKWAGEDNKLYDRFLEQYYDHADNEFSAIFLTEISPNNSFSGLNRNLYKACKEYVERFPSSRFLPNVQNLITALTVKKINAVFPNAVSPNSPFDFEITCVNGRQVKIEIFDVTNDVSNAATIQKLPNASPILVKELNFNYSVPFEATAKIHLMLPRYGYYAVRSSVDNVVEEPGFSLIRATDLSVGVSYDDTTSTAWIVDAKSGEPVEDASLIFSPWSRRSNNKTIDGHSNKDGAISVDINESGSLTPEKGDDRYAPATSYSRPYKYSREKYYESAIFTALALYRPGDTVDFAAIAYEVTDRERKIAADALLSVELRDANYSPVDTLVQRTDAWGRMEGKFELPSETLTGNFYLNAIAIDGQPISGSRNFMVSDYKLSEFEITTDEITRPSGNSDAIVRGSAKSFSGFPISNAKVELNMSVSAGNWWNSYTSPVFYVAESQTDSDGSFTFEIPRDIIVSSPAPHGRFICDITVTSENGESHSKTVQFNMGKPLEIRVSVPSQINRKVAFTATAEAVDPLGEKRNIELKYLISTDSTTISQGVILSGNINSIISSLAPGCYSAEFEPVDSTLAAPAPLTRFVVYDPTSGPSPSASHLWMPTQVVRATAEGVAPVILGASEDGVNVLVITSILPGKMVDSRWITLRKGMQTVNLSLPKDGEGVSVNILSVKDFKRATYKFDVLPVEEAPKIKEVTTFRDKVAPGSLEKVQVVVKAENGATLPAAVMLDMSNKAIDVLNPNQLYLPPFQPRSCNAYLEGFYFGNASSNVQQSSKYLTEFVAITPRFNTYGQTLVSRLFYKSANRTMMRKSRMAGSAAAADADGVEIVTEMADTQMLASGAVVTESVEEVAESDNGTTSSPSAENDTYRPSEIPLAFFHPMLTTQDDGSLVVEYLVPNANTTWVLRALAYNNQLLSSNSESQIVASKPIMVKINAPRFVRSGDTLKIPATVMNNSDSIVALDVTIELLSSSDNQVLRSEVSHIEVGARQQHTVSMPIADFGSLPGMIFRVKACQSEGKAMDNVTYSDGEQVFIPVLPSQQDVVESEIFYLAPNQQQFSMELPEIQPGSRAYLNFTENPAWEVVSALPGLRKYEVNSSIEACSALFSAAIAEGIVKENPEIGRTLRRWIESGDSALMSNLDKNQQLKSVLLSSTPWISEALDDTERMQRLALLFDAKETAKVKRDAIAKLAKCSVDGGWCWTEQYPAVSQWATMVILDQLGQLNRMGYLPSDPRLRSMIKTAVEYVDRQEVKDFNKYPKLDRWHYVLMRDRFPEYKPSTAASRVIEAEVQRALAGWKQADVPVKGVYAMILNNHGYHATSRQVLASLRELSTSTPERGMWWQQLDKYTSLWSYNRLGITSLLLNAFNEIEPSGVDVQKIRQWLILNKTNNDWGNSIMTTQVVASILKSGKPLTVNPRGTAIHVGDQLVVPSAEEYATGAFTENISSLLVDSEILTIDRQADYPSVGAVVLMRTLPMGSIRSADCKEVAIDKNLTVFKDGQWVESELFNVGDKVKVELILKVEDDLSYVIIEDQRAAGLEPVEQLPKPIYSEGLRFYRENRDSQTNIFIDRLPRGTYRLEYELYASQAGSFASGAAGIQSQYNPIVSAHSAGASINIKE